MNDALSLEDNDLEGLIAEATDAFLERAQSGDPVNVEEFSQGYPLIADILRELLPAMQVMQQSSSPLTGRPVLPVSVPGRSAPWAIST